MVNDAVRNLRHERGLRRRHRILRLHAWVGQRAGKPIVGVQELKNRSDGHRAGNDTNCERDLLTPGRSADHASGFQILEIVVRDRRDRHHDRGYEKGQRHGEAASLATAHRDRKAETSRDQDRGQNADARNGAAR